MHYGRCGYEIDKGATRMNAAEARLIEEGWAALVDRLGLAEATRFVMLLDRPSGSGLQHLRSLQSSVPTTLPTHKRTPRRSYSSDYFHRRGDSYPDAMHE
jgi:hypothetical protein